MSAIIEARQDWLSGSCGCPDNIWPWLRELAMAAAAREPLLRPYLERSVGEQDSFAAALAEILAARLADRSLGHGPLKALVLEQMARDPEIEAAMRADLCATVQRDPAAGDPLTPFLHFKGFHALCWHRVAHALYVAGRQEMAFFLQSRVAQAFGVDIHPAVPLGLRVLLDHATGLVVGETAVIGNDVSILHGVTLGGTGKETGDRHPKIHDGVLLAAGSTVLGNITVGENAKVAAGSVVLHPVPPCATVAGVPAKVVGWCAGAPALSMDQGLGI